LNQEQISGQPESVFLPKKERADKFILKKSLSQGKEMKYQGGCHCGQVRFEIKIANFKLITCDCSICTKKGALHLRCAPVDFTLLKGLEALSEYRFNTREATHFFCKSCGIHTHSHPRIAPDQYSLNARCLDDFNEIQGKFERAFFQGSDSPPAQGCETSRRLT